MDDNIPFAIAFLLGLGSSFHCIGMCGGIISALSLSLPVQTRNQPLQLLTLVCAYNVGRIGSYSLAGGLIGYFAYLSPLSSSGSFIYLIIQCLASAFLVGLGLHIAGWFPQMKKIEAAGLILWKYLQPFGKRFVPANNIPKAVMAGAVWGWLPCGLVYSVLLWTLSSMDPLKGALYMFMFGLGTLPSMISAGLASNAIMLMSAQAKLRTAAGIFIIVLGLASPFLNISSLTHSGGSSPSTGASHH
ncbi:MAG: sulfite exporter TauE/SafE [Gammaproteobacteria bacterium]|jgi:sulfite exporter TauE/SafE